MKRIFGAPLSHYAPGLALLAIVAIYLATAYGYRSDSRAFPVSVAWTMVGLTFLDLVSRTRTNLGRTIMHWLNPAGDPEKIERQPHYAVSKQVLALSWLAGFVALLVLIGILPAVAIYVFASMWLRGRRPILICAVASGAVTLLVWALFVQLLQLQLYPGWLFGGY